MIQPPRQIWRPAIEIRDKRGFTLPAVMIVMAAVLTMAIGLLLIVGIERRSARGVVDQRRAELATRAGMQELRGVLLEQTANDDFFIVEKQAEGIPGDPRDPAHHLFLARGKPGEDGVSYRFHPLFSVDSAPPEADSLLVPDARPLIGGESAEPAEIQAMPWMEAAPVAWIPLKDSNGRVIARYAYWVEDLQGRLDATIAGNTDGTDGVHARNQYPFPAPGLNPAPESPEEPTLDRIALHAIDPASGADDKSDIDNRAIEGRMTMVSPGSVLAAAKIKPPLNRGPDGHLVDPRARALEENTAAGLRSYEEQPLVPAIPGIDPAAIGLPKLNLNALLAMDRDAAIDKMADWIADALPEFAAERKGGFPDDYLRTLAANALDYADADSEASVKAGSYRGLDAYPLASEFMMMAQFLKKSEKGGRTYYHWRFSLFIELWNMTDQPASGRMRVTYENGYQIPSVGAIPAGMRFDDEELLDDPQQARHSLTKEGGRWWFPPINVSLGPDEYKVFRLGQVSYIIDGTPDFGEPAKKIELTTGRPGVSGYRMEWNGTVVDMARGGLTLTTSSKGVKPNWTAGKATVPGHTYGIYGNWIDNMGDPRMAAYIQWYQDANAYPENYSPNRRTIRWQTIYKSDAKTKPKVFGRVLPSEWPDGGHDSDYGSNHFVTRNDRLFPDDKRFFVGFPNARAGNAPTRISNSGRFFSPTELGRVYDPIMWRPTFKDNLDTDMIQSGIMPASQKRWPDVISKSVADPHHGGGNTLRIGRPEHPRFDRSGLRAACLLDLFHAGRSRSDDSALRESPLVMVEGRVNLNTASFDSLRALAAGWLGADPELARVTSNSHETKTKMALPTARLKLSAPSEKYEADTIARAIMEARPFASRSQVGEARDAKGRPVFGNRELYPGGERIQWADPATEELFARVYEASTVRSRNFRVWVIGQALAPMDTATVEPKILAESRMVFNLFADPGEREPDGALAPDRHDVIVTYENGF